MIASLSTLSEPHVGQAFQLDFQAVRLKSLTYGLISILF